MNTALAINDVITGVTTPRTNMEVASHIAAGNFGVSSFAFNKEIHDYLISKGGEFIFRSIGYYQYIFNIKDERFCFVQYHSSKSVIIILPDRI